MHADLEHVTQLILVQDNKLNKERKKENITRLFPMIMVYIQLNKAQNFKPFQVGNFIFESKISEILNVDYTVIFVNEEDDLQQNCYLKNDI